MGPLSGIRVVELAAIGPVPFAGMLFADMGADVVRVERIAAVTGGHRGAPPLELLNRGKKSIAIDLKHPEGASVLLRLVAGSDVLLEGFRPGVAERLGVGPAACSAHNPGLVYGRMTGWGQEGPLAQTAGHDIDYIAIAGALHPIGRESEPPPPPLNLIGDYGGGALYLVAGVLAALVERGNSGEGQVVDAAMVDGAASLTTFIHQLRAEGLWTSRRQSNILDGAAPWYGVYGTVDGRYVAVGAIEPHFYADLLRGLELDAADLPAQLDRDSWPGMRELFASLFAGKTQQQWVEVFEGSDACVAPVMSLADAPLHPHLVERGTFIEVGGVLQPGPAPRFSRTATVVSGAPPHAGEDTTAVFEAAGFDSVEIARLRSIGAIA